MRARVGLICLLSVCLAAGCRSGSSTRGGSSQAPLVIGLINTEGAPVGSFPELRVGALAAQDYLNEKSGGVNGRPIRITPCTSDGTPESSQACANRLISAHAIAVIGGVDLGAAASLGPLQGAGVPYVGGTPAATEALTGSGSYMLTGGTATEVLGELQYAATTLHAKRMAVVYSDVPGLLSSAVTLLHTIAGKLGVSLLKTFPVEASAPDVVPALSAAAAIHPDAIIAVFPAQGCTRLVQAVTSIDLRARMMYPSFCATDSVLAAGGQRVNESIFATGYVPYVDASDPDVRTYLSAIRSHGGSQPSLLSQAGFSDVVVLQRILAGLGTSPTASAVGAALRQARDQAGFMSHSFTCDGRQVPLLGGLCNAYVKISVVRSGRLQTVPGWVDTAPTARLAIP